MNAPHAILAALVALFAGALISLALCSRRTLAGYVALFSAVVACGLSFYAAGRVLLHGPDGAAVLWAIQSWGFALRIYVDGLSAVFLVLICLVALPAAWYSIPYLDHYPQYGVGRYYPNLLLFIAGMIGLICTTDAMFFFFVFWQLMTLTSFALVRFENREPANIKAAWKYLVMMQVACLSTMIGAELLAATSVNTGTEVLLKYDFDAISHHVPAMLQQNRGVVTVAMSLFLVGFGIKAGMWPFGQVWLPDAHPAAPSPVSALLSGVMIKTGVYGIMRYFIWLLPVPMAGGYCHAWGWVITILGLITMLVGTAQALPQAQTKRLLAYSSIGQVGYMLTGVGVCLVLLGTPRLELAVLAFCGALFHVLNHGLFKGLLFLNAGSVLCATGTQDLNRLGGLVRFMPVTALAAFVGILSIAGTPLSNGFVSKWHLYSAAILSGDWARYLPVVALIAIFTSALTLAVFVRFYGAAFLSRSSSQVRELARQKPSLEVGWGMLLPKLWLAGWCVVIGLAPVLGVNLLGAALDKSRQGMGVILADNLPYGGSFAGGVSVDLHNALIIPLVAGVVLMTMVFLARAISKLGGSVRRSDAPWLCGYAREAEHNRYGARHFYGAIQGCLRRIVRVPGPAPCAIINEKKSPPAQKVK